MMIRPMDGQVSGVFFVSGNMLFMLMGIVT